MLKFMQKKKKKQFLKFLSYRQHSSNSTSHASLELLHPVSLSPVTGIPSESHTDTHAHNEQYQMHTTNTLT